MILHLIWTEGNSMIFSTFYFSGTGNTKWVVEQLNSIVSKNGHQAEMYSIDNNEKFTEDLLRNIIHESDFIGFANPIYGADIPPIMKRFISRLIDIQKKEKATSKLTYMINTFAYVNAFGPFAAKRLFTNTCFHLRAYVNIRICNNISTPKRKAEKINKTELIKRKEQAKKELLFMTDRLLSEKRYITGIGPYLIPGIVIRKMLGKAVKNNYKSLSVKTETCNKCMLCVNNCPNHSIEIKDSQFKFSADCTACMRCYNFCPTASIMIDGLFADSNEYQRYHGPDTE